MDDSAHNSYSSGSQQKPKLEISSEKTRIQFSQKMRDMARNEIEKETERVANELDLPYINLEKFPINPDALQIIDRETAEKHGVVCFVNLGNEMRVGTPDPENQHVQSMLIQLKEERPLVNIILYLISQPSLEKALKLYELLPETKNLDRGVTITEEDLARFSQGAINFAAIESEMKKVSITDLVTYIIASALQADASDIHIEAEEKNIKIRYRLDGILQDVAILQRAVWKRLDSRIKLLAALKINVENVPQDGRFSIKTKKEKIDVRVSTLPTNYGESIVMRLLQSSKARLSFADLGVSEKIYSKLETEIKRPNGMIITTGPTGSGKTTTLYAIINELNKPGVKIITVENPIEYQLVGINQSQVDESRGYTFANGLRSILRQDPDIVMVGEIRDQDTADMAIQASLTGHLVISTLHTNSAAGAVPRFLSMGAQSFLLAPALNAVIGQRLVRRLCGQCKTTYTPT